MYRIPEAHETPATSQKLRKRNELNMNQRLSVQTSGIKNGISPKAVKPEEKKLIPEIYPSYVVHSRQVNDCRGYCAAFGRSP